MAGWVFIDFENDADLGFLSHVPGGVGSYPNAMAIF